MTQDTGKITKIIELAPPFLKLPVQGYGGSERVLWACVEEFSRAAAKDPQAPKLQLWAPGDSAPTTRDGHPIDLHATVPHAQGFSQLWTSFRQVTRDMYDLRRTLINQPGTVAHIHTEDAAFPIIGGAGPEVSTRTLTTMHNLPKDWATEFHQEMPVVAISHAQAQRIKGFDFLRVIHNGIDPALFVPSDTLPPDAPFAFLGRFSPDKNPVDAIKIALAAQSAIRLAGITDSDAPAYKAQLDALIAAHPSQVQFIGEVNDVIDPRMGQSSKSAFLAGSKALLLPIKWAEPFGLVIAEANAAGTPVIAYNYPGSSVDELIKDGVNGFKVNSFEEAVAAAKAIDQIDRRGVRAHFEKNFTTGIMAQKYSDVITKDLPAYRRSLGLGR